MIAHCICMYVKSARRICNPGRVRDSLFCYTCSMAVLIIHLDKEESERRENVSSSGLPLAISLYREFELFSPIVIVAPTEEAVSFQGGTCFTVVFKSPITERMSASFSSSPVGFSLYSSGYEAVVIVGRSRKLQFLSLSSEGVLYIPAEECRGLTSLETEMRMRRSLTDVFLTIGRAGENGVLYAALQSGGKEAIGMGLGCLFGWKNLKGIMLPGFSRKDSLKNEKIHKRVRRRTEKSSICRRFRREGSSAIIDSALLLGWLPVEYYSERFDPRAYFLDGKALSDAYGVYPESCQECSFACGRRTKDNQILPSYVECIMLGSNLGFYSLESVRVIADAVRTEGLSAADTGALLANLRTLPGDDYTLPVFRGKGAEEYVRVIHLIGENRGLGEKLQQGLKTFPDAIGMGCLPLLTDLRGDKAGAVLASLSLMYPLFASWILPKKPLSDRAGAIMALYETAYGLALSSRGFVPMGSVAEWWAKLPRFVFRFPFLLRLSALLFRAYGIKGLDILEEGIAKMDELAKPGEIHKHFVLDPESAVGDGSTVSPVRIRAYYEREKRIALMILKSIREKRRKPSGRNKAAVGPSEDLGREGDPGLQRIAPPEDVSDGT